MDSVIAITNNRCLFAYLPSHGYRWQGEKRVPCKTTWRHHLWNLAEPSYGCNHGITMMSATTFGGWFLSRRRTIKVAPKGEDEIDSAENQHQGTHAVVCVTACASSGDRQTTGVTLPYEKEKQRLLVHREISVKICGVAYPEDATWAARCGADYVGMILWPKSKRSISRQQAVDVASAAKEHGAVPVGVFVEEGVEEIVDLCTSSGISIAQLHGDGARCALGDVPDWLQVVYVLNADKHGVLQTSSLSGLIGQSHTEEEGSCRHANRLVDWVLIDGLYGGSGERIDWEGLNVPKNISKHGWWLAGGLHPGNVKTAVQILFPDAVDVSSGVAGIDGVRKDLNKVKSFISNAKSAALPAPAG